MTGAIAGAVLQAARRSAGLTQEGLAEAAGYSVDTVKRWESGQRPLGHVKAAELTRLQRQLRALGARPGLLATLPAAIDVGEFTAQAVAGDCGQLASEVMTRSWSSLVAWAATGTPTAAAADVVPARPLLGAGTRQALFASVRVAAERADPGDGGCLLRHQAYYLAAMDATPEGAAWLADATRTETARIRLTGRWNPAWAVARSMAVAAACQGDPGPLRWFIGHHLAADECAEANLCYWSLWAGSDPEPADGEEFMAERRMDMRKGAGLLRHLTAHLSADLPYADLSVVSLRAILARWPVLLRYDPAVAADLGARTAAMLDGGVAASSRPALSDLHTAVLRAA